MSYPTLEDLVREGYLKENETTCPNKEEIMITSEGEVRLANAKSEAGSGG